MIIIPRNTDGKYKHDPMGADESRCVICGRPIKDGSGYLIHVHDGGKVAVRPDELDFLYSNRLLTESGDMGLQAIGADCLNRHPELLSYIDKSEPLTFVS